MNAGSDSRSDNTPDHSLKGSSPGQESNKSEAGATSEQTNPDPHKPKWFRRFSAWLRPKLKGHTFLEWLTFVFEVLTFTVFCVYTYYAGGQWSVMRGQLEQMKGGSVQADRVIANMNWLARSMDGALKESQRASGDNEKRAKEALVASIAASTNAQRAMVGPSQSQMQTFKAGAPEVLAITTMVNTGRGIATVDGKAVLIIVINQKPSDYIKSERWNQRELVGPFTIFPGTTFDIPSVITTEEAQVMVNNLRKEAERLMPTPEFKQMMAIQSLFSPVDVITGLMKQKGVSVYIIGDFHYTDVFSKAKHRTLFCQEYDPIHNRFTTQCKGFPAYAD